MAEKPALSIFEALVIDRLKLRGGRITARGYHAHVEKFGLDSLDEEVSVTKFRNALGRLNFIHELIQVTHSDPQGLSDSEERETTISLRKRG